MRRHAVMRHRPPGMIFRCRLGIPDIASVASKLSALKSANNGVAVTDSAACRIHEISTTLHFADERVVEEVLGFRVQWRVDGNHVTNPHHRLDVWVVRDTQL